MVFILLLFGCFACTPYRDMDIETDVELLQEGIQTSSLIGYSASLASSAFNDTILPDNLIFQEIYRDESTSNGLITVAINDTFPLPFIGGSGFLTIAGLWDYNQGGVISVLCTGLNMNLGSLPLFGFYTVPIIMEDEDQTILAVFAEQDIIVGEGSDTILNLNLTNPQFNNELNRLETNLPGDPFAAVTQNVWFIRINQQNTADLYDDVFSLYGGGQIVEATSTSGGILYHALIGTKLQYHVCPLNPTDGIGFLQNLKAGDGLELGTLLLEFHSNCDGNAFVQIGTGKYFGLGGQYLDIINDD